jgi:hypothetical protein
MVSSAPWGRQFVRLRWDSLRETRVYRRSGEDEEPYEIQLDTPQRTITLAWRTLQAYGRPFSLELLARYIEARTASDSTLRVALRDPPTTMREANVIEGALRQEYYSTKGLRAVGFASALVFLLPSLFLGVPIWMGRVCGTVMIGSVSIMCWFRHRACQKALAKLDLQRQTLEDGRM